MITDTTAKKIYTIAEGVTEYPIGFSYQYNPDDTPQIKVYKNKHPELPMAYGDDYEISDNGLNVVLLGNYEVGDRLVIMRDIPAVQLSDYHVGRIDPNQLEADFDEAVMRDQSIQAQLDSLAEMPIDHETRIVAIEDKIPEAASSTNQLADKNYVVAAINTKANTLQDKITNEAKLSADLVDDEETTHKFVTAADKTNWNAKQDGLTTAQLDAVNSGVTSTTVSQVEANTSAIATKVAANADIIGSTKCKITYDAKGLVTGGDDISTSDLTDVAISSVQEAQVLAYNATAKKWENRTSQMSVAFDGITGNALDNTSIASLIAAIYPIGSVYIGTQNTCPMGALISGSTWELVSSGRALWTGNGTNANTTIAAGLPNVEGTLWAKTGYNNQGTGAFSNIQTTGSQGWDGSSQHTQYRFRASDANSTYGNSSTVQPPAYVVNVWRRTA